MAIPEILCKFESPYLKRDVLQRDSLGHIIGQNGCPMTSSQINQVDSLELRVMSGNLFETDTFPKMHGRIDIQHFPSVEDSSVKVNSYKIRGPSFKTTVHKNSSQRISNLWITGAIS